MRTVVAKAERTGDQLDLVMRNTVELDGGDKPVMVSEPMTRYYLDPSLET